ncbi:DUF1800 domain-containing protein [Coraliomargarita sinensis]|uniref:DUF1800 domain-containing protein n=1 Tax=Coraliomargarita sinensis TaxID=2174842 RepID=A0A317ZIT6_9BACT|nr:DUF1800 family protein [Coraliomargarita sinensis]PXA04133.1 DUF1800 domain-containing protein [Coraliomargarita sinensis]
MDAHAPTPENFKVEDAWKPLPAHVWDKETAAHLLRRIGFSATPEVIQDALRHRPAEAIRNAFVSAEPLAMTDELSKFTKTAHEAYRSIYREIRDPEKKREKRNELRQQDNELFREFAMSWFQQALKPENSANEKFVLFLQDVFVVDRRTVRDTPVLFSLMKILREGIRIKYPDLCKWVSREPAMIRYLNLDKNTARKPNENFARELFELFTLGEGNYTETDIKEAAKAFTGYRTRERYEFHFQRRLHDSGLKTVFGEEGTWDGDEVIDITFKQPAAKTFLIRELIKFYLTDEDIPEPYIESLGEQWAAHNFDLTYLIETFFQSRLFFHPAYRGNLVKSPIQFYLGLCQDLRLDLIPFQGRLLKSMDVMGQSFYNPPNVRGWLYGEHWINSTTISARRQLVDYLFSPLNEKRLNGNDQRDLKAARQEQRGEFLVTQERLEPLLKLDPSKIAEHLTTYFITPRSRPAYQPVMEEIVASSDHPEKALRYVITALLQSPAYNIC